ncbi:MAG: InlB B-repeat-containing protein [Clostridiales Family XIII bacterium]|jgi:uncharacterized repeat protein (TIGR02543 family)|nr:InlB B-repeat-containing protein [Clostridiales Family XIII bacterium]
MNNKEQETKVGSIWKILPGGGAPLRGKAKRHLSFLLVIVMLATIMLPFGSFADGETLSEQEDYETPVAQADGDTTEAPSLAEPTNSIEGLSEEPEIESLGDSEIGTLAGGPLATVNVQLKTRVNGNVFAAYTDSTDYDLIWDYVEDFYYQTIVDITPTATGAAGSILLEAPQGMRFIKPSASQIPAAISSIDIAGRLATLTLSDSAIAGNLFQIPFMTCEASMTSTLTDNPWLANHLTKVGNMVGTAIKDAAVNFAPMPAFTTTVSDSNDNQLKILKAIPKKYKTENIFGGFYYANDKPYSSAKTNPGMITKEGLVGGFCMPIHGTYNTYPERFGVGFYYHLDTPDIHEPYWNLTFKIEIPSDLEIGDLGPQDKVEEIDGKTYVILENMTDNTNGAYGINPLRMLNPAADALDSNNEFGTRVLTSYIGSGGAYTGGIVPFAVRLDLKLKSGIQPTSEKSYTLPVTVGYTNAYDTYSQTFDYVINTNSFESVDLYKIQYPTWSSGYAWDMYPRSLGTNDIDLPQNWEGDTSEYNEFVRIFTTANASQLNDPHSNGTLELTPGQGYEVYSVTLPKVVSADYYIGATKYTDATKSDDTFSFPAATSGNRVTKVVLHFGPEGIDLQKNTDGTDSTILLYLGLRTLDNVDGTSMGESYKSSLGVALKGADEHTTGYDAAHLPQEHAVPLDVFIRKPADNLILQTYGNAPANFTTNIRPFLAGRGGSVVNTATVAFGYSDSLHSSDKKGSWKIYEDVSIDFTGARALETFNGIVTIGKYLSYTDAKFIYTTNQVTTERTKEVDLDVGTFTPSDIGAEQIVDLGLDADEYITSIRFEADTFMPTVVWYGGTAFREFWGAYGGAKINFSSRDGRNYLSDDSPIPQYIVGDESTILPFDASFAAKNVGERASTSYTVLPVSFDRYKNTNFDGPLFRYTVNGGQQIDAGSVFNANMSVRQQNTTPGDEGLVTPMKDTSIVVKLNPNFIYAGTSPDVKVVTDKTGEKWLVISNLPDGNIYNFDIPLMALLSTPQGQVQVIQEAYIDMTATWNKDYASNVYPYLVATHYHGVDTYEKFNFDDTIDRDGDGIYEEGAMFAIPSTTNNVLVSYADTVQIVPAVAANANIKGVVFHDDNVQNLSANLYIGSATTTKTDYEVDVHIPKTGDETSYFDGSSTQTETANFDLHLRGPVNTASEGPTSVITYSVNGGAFISEAEVSGNWENVTDIRIHFDNFPGDTYVIAGLDLKATVDPILNYGDVASISTKHSYVGIPAQGYSNLARYEYRLSNVDVHYLADYDIADEDDDLDEADVIKVKDGEYLELRETGLAYDSKIVEPTFKPEREGYAFDGWVTESDGSTFFDYDVTVKNHTNLYAKWTKLHTVNFSTGDNGSLQSGKDSYEDIRNKTLWTSAITSAIPTPVPAEDYFFKGWYDTDEKLVDLTADSLISHKIVSDEVYTALFEKKHDLVVTALNASATYNGKEQKASVKGEVTGELVTGHSVSSSAGAGKGTDAGAYDTEITKFALEDSEGEEVDLDTYYNITFEKGVYEIAKLSVKVKPVYAEKVYDGTALKPSAVELVSGQGKLLGGHRLHIGEVIWMGERTEPGTTQTNVFNVKVHAVADESDVTQNYNILTDKGLIKVIPAPKPPVITPDTYSVTYLANGATAGLVPTDDNAYELESSASVFGNVGGLARTGYTFLGWSEDGGAVAATYAGGETLTIVGDVVLYAIWEPVGTPPRPRPPVIIDPPDEDTDVIDREIDEPVEPEATLTNVQPAARLTASAVLASAAMDQGIPVLGIGESGVPLIAPAGFSAWAILNLILCAIGLILAIVMFFHLFRRQLKRAKEEGKAADSFYGYDADEEQKRSRKIFMILSALLAVVGVVLFMLTEDMTLPMVLLDKWTIANAIILLVEIVAVKLTFKRLDEEEEASEEPLRV